MGLIRWLVGGLIGGAIGVAIWVLIGYYTHYEIGWIAWGIGFLSGIGVRYAAHLGNEDEGFVQGLVASVVAIGSVVTAKYLVFILMVGGFTGMSASEFVESVGYDDESLIVSLADEIAQQRIDSGLTLEWPAGMTIEEAISKEDYPVEVWELAQKQWDGFSDEEKEKRKQERKELVEAMFTNLMGPQFSDQFDYWDVLWLGLATVTAFQLGTGAYGDD